MEDASFTHLVVVGSSAGGVEALHQNEARWRALIDKGANVITISDRDGIVRFASPSVETVCGYAAEEFVGTHLFEAGRIHPEDLERSRRLSASSQLVGGGGVFVSEPGGGTKVEASIQFEEA